MESKDGPDSWPHHWFGLWKEDGYEECPSVQDFILPDRPQPEDIEEILSYLSQGYSPVAAGSFNDPVSGEHVMRSMAFRSDGEWQWCDSLPYLVERYGLSLPDGLIEAARKNRYVPPPLTREQGRRLLVPPECTSTWRELEDSLGS